MWGPFLKTIIKRQTCTNFKNKSNKYENNATNTTATSGDLELSAFGTSGSVIIELRKDESFTA